MVSILKMMIQRTNAIGGIMVGTVGTVGMAIIGMTGMIGITGTMISMMMTGEESAEVDLLHRLEARVAYHEA